MSLEISVSPSGALSIEPMPEAMPAVEEKWRNRLQAAFENSRGEGLLFLVGEALSLPLPPSLSYWRDFARRFLHRLCQASTGENRVVIPAVTDADDLASFAREAPPMRGGEFLDVALLERLWQEMGKFVEAVAQDGLAAWLKTTGSHWHTVGRVTFHLAENKRDPERPFAFLATYTHQLAASGKPQHLPLAKALQEYAGPKHTSVLANLLAPVQRAVEKSPLARDLFESRRIFQPMAWTPREAHRFLRDIPVFEESGVVVRVPDWWRSGRPSRAVVKVRVGETRSALLGMESLLDFKVDVALDGAPLTDQEWAEIAASEENLVLLKGKWVEIDRDQLKQVLAHWRQVEKESGEISFLEGMRMLAGMGRYVAGEAEIEATSREWSQVVPGEWLRQTLAAMRDPSSAGKEFNPERDLHASLREYQRTGVHWLWFMTRLGLGACLADDMGLGKTIQTIALLLQVKRESGDKAARAPSLLVAPASLLANWKNEIARFAPTLRVFFAHPSETPAVTLKDVASDPAQSLAGFDLVVTTYSVLHRLEWLRQFQWRLGVLDEAQAIKNPGSRQTRAVKELRTQARIALTGTPIENRLGDLWSLFDFLCPGLLGTTTQFSRTVKALTIDKVRHFAPLRNLTQPYILRRLKTDRSIISDLPDKTEVTAWCALSRTQAALYEKAVGELESKLGDVDGITRRGLVLAFLMRFKQICNHPSQWLGDGRFDPAASGKFIRLSDLAEEIAARQEKVLIFTQFREMTAPLSGYLEGVFGRPGLILHGGTPVKQRQNLVASFQEESGPPFFVLSLKAGGTGLNLTAASHVIHFDRWWNPAVENQATDRAFRIGQKRNVLVHKFVCRGTIEERINALMEEKKSLAADVLEGGGEQVLTEMGDDELLRFVSLDLKSAVQD